MLFSVALAALALSPVGVDAARVKRQGFAFPGQGGASFPNFGGFQGAAFPQQNFQSQNNQGGGFPQNGFPQQGFQGNQGGFPQQGFQGNQGGFPQQQGGNQGGFPQQGFQGNQDGFPQQQGGQQGNLGNQQPEIAPQQGQLNAINNIAPTTQRVIDLRPTSPTPAPRTTVRPLQVQQCTEDCIPQTANPYNPVCGSDGTNYHNRERLECYRRCGVGELLLVTCLASSY